MMKTERPRNEKNRGNGRRERRDRPAPDPVVLELIRTAETRLMDSLEPVILTSMNALHAKQVQHHFTRSTEYDAKTIRVTGEEASLRIYPVGKIKRLAETKAREVLLTGKPQTLMPMDSYGRFVVHEYVKSRGGLRSESCGDEAGRHVEIFPVFGRTPRKVKRRLTR